MIIVVAALEFGSEKDRDEAVALTADVQRLTREEEPGCHDYCLPPIPQSQHACKFMNYGQTARVWLHIFSTRITSVWRACCKALVL